jgi:hypothetical protein
MNIPSKPKMKVGPYVKKIIPKPNIPVPVKKPVTVVKKPDLSTIQRPNLSTILKPAVNITPPAEAPKPPPSTIVPKPPISTIKLIPETPLLTISPASKPLLTPPDGKQPMISNIKTPSSNIFGAKKIVPSFLKQVCQPVKLSDISTQIGVFVPKKKKIEEVKMPIVKESEPVEEEVKTVVQEKETKAETGITIDEALVKKRI